MDRIDVKFQKTGEIFPPSPQFSDKAAEIINPVLLEPTQKSFVTMLEEFRRHS
jgi:hypothetical protein